MEKKRCLFCNQFVMVKPGGEEDRYIGCYCSPYGEFSLNKGSYEPFNQLSYQKKNQLFPVISAYIREFTDQGGTAAISFDDVEAIWNSSERPVTIEEKGNRLLQYLHRHSDAPGDPVTITIAESFNLTYSPNLQELVYIIEKLKDEESIIREGSVLRLTEKGWRAAAARAGDKRLKSCFILFSKERDEEYRKQWTEHILPKIQQCGYLPHLSDETEVKGSEKQSEYMVRLVSESNLLIADVTGQPPEVYFAAGYALGLEIPVIWTLQRSDPGTMSIQSEHIRPIRWDNTEELAAVLQQILS